MPSGAAVLGGRVGATEALRAVLVLVRVVHRKARAPFWTRLAAVKRFMGDMTLTRVSEEQLGAFILLGTRALGWKVEYKEELLACSIRLLPRTQQLHFTYHY